jgi:hypothetical protein
LIEVASIGSLKVTVIFPSVRIPMALFAGLTETIVGGTLSGGDAVKVRVTAVAKAFPTTSVMPIVARAVMTVPTSANS